MILLFAIFTILTHADPPPADNLSKCGVEHREMSDLRAAIEEYKKVCGEYPAQMIQLLGSPSACEKWRRHPAVTDRGVLGGFSYQRTGHTYKLNMLDCPI